VTKVARLIANSNNWVKILSTGTLLYHFYNALLCYYEIRNLQTVKTLEISKRNYKLTMLLSLFDTSPTMAFANQTHFLAAAFLIMGFLVEVEVTLRLTVSVNMSWWRTPLWGP
jgi:hypothetical protein